MDCMKDTLFLQEHTENYNVQINPSIIPFITMMNVDDEKRFLHPYVAPVNHNELNNTKTKEIMYSILDYGNSDGKNVSQLNNLGNDAVILIGFQDNVRLYLLFQIFANLFILTQFSPLQSKSDGIDNTSILINMKVLNLLPEKKNITATLLPSTNDFDKNCLMNEEFKSFLKYDGTTGDGRTAIATYYNVLTEWNEFITIVTLFKTITIY